MNYIDKIDLQRVAKKLSFRAFGEICNLPEPTVKWILSKKGTPKITSIEKMCEALGFSMAQLFCGKDEIILKSADSPTELIIAFGALSDEAKSHVAWIIKNLFGR